MFLQEKIEKFIVWSFKSDSPETNSNSARKKVILYPLDYKGKQIW